jgi:hypothetical protein
MKGSGTCASGHTCASGQRLRLDADVPPGDRAAGINLHANEAGRAPAVSVGVVEGRRLPAFAGPGVGQEDGIVVAANDDFVLEPDTGNQIRSPAWIL